VPTSSDKIIFSNASVIPYDGLYEQPYTIYLWSVDVYSVSKEYHNSIPYKEGTPVINFVQPWMLFLLLIGFLGIAYVRAFHRKRFSMLFQTFINWKLSKQIIRYEKVYTHPANLILTLIYLFSIPLFLALSYKITSSSQFALSQLFFIIQIPLLFYILLKFIAYRFTAWLLDEKEVIEEYVFQANLFNKYLAVSYLILSTLLLYSRFSPNVLIGIGLAILLSFLLFQVIRGLIIGIENGKSLYLIILYLCTLEILPWLILGKWINTGL
jgi:hypothetical protein